MSTRILVIEDNKEVRENISEILELSDYTVVSADNGKTGVETALKEPFDLVVCDIMMPQLDGYGVLHLLSKHTATRNIPFLFLTAKSEKADFRKGMEMGADDYLTKPFDGNELLHAIEVRLKKAAQVVKNPVVADNFTGNLSGADIIQAITGNREIQEYKKKQLLYSEGQRPKFLYYILKGKVKIYKTNQDGKELIINIFKAGDYWGYTAILQNEQYRENAEIVDDASLVLIPAAEFLDMIHKDTTIARQFIKLTAGNVLEKEEDLLNLAYGSLRKKVAYALVQQALIFKEPGQPFTILHLSRKEMAQVTGVATESLIRTLADFKDEKFIDIRLGKVVILNETGLKNLPN